MPTHPRDRSIWPIGLMTLIATALLGMSMREVLAPALIAGPLVSHLITGWPRMPKPRMFLHVLMGVPFVLWFRYGIHNVATPYVPIVMLFIMGFYMLALAVHHLLSLRVGGSKDHALGCTVLALGVAGAGTREFQAAYTTLVSIFAVLLVVHLRWELVRRNPYRRSRTWSWPWYAAALLVLTGTVYFFEEKLVPRVPEASSWLVKRLIPSSGRASLGFERSAKLGSIADIRGSGTMLEEVMLRVFTERLADPYLRGAVYDTYGEGSGVWSAVPETTPIQPHGKDHAGRNIFNTRPVASDETLGTAYPEPEVAGSFFLPLGVHQISSFTERALTGTGQTIRPEVDGASGGYAFYTPSVKDLGGPGPEDTQVPWWIRRGMWYYVLDSGIEGMPTTAKLRRVEAWFAENFSYKIGFEVMPFAGDPLLQFMVKREGHCEYFASAAVMMLRCVGVPTRYVTGFVADEPGPGGWWVARRKHAHAWAEAWVEGQGWVRVEATPPDGQPRAFTAAQGPHPWREWFSAQWARLRQLALYGGLTGLLGAAWDYLMSLPGKVPVPAWVVLISAGMAWIFRDSIKGWWRRRPPEPVSERVKDLRKKLATVEKQLRRYGLTREPSLTVAGYLRRVRAAANLPSHVRARVLPLLDQYVHERFTRE